MSTQVFVPITDDIIYNHPEQIEGPLVPYFAGMECHNWLTIEINPDESEPVDHGVQGKAIETVEAGQTGERPGLRLAYSA